MPYRCSVGVAGVRTVDPGFEPGCCESYMVREHASAFPITAGDKLFELCNPIWFSACDRHSQHPRSVRERLSRTKNARSIAIGKHLLRHLTALDPAGSNKPNAERDTTGHEGDGGRDSQDHVSGWQ